MSDTPRLLGIDDALHIVQRLIDVSEARHVAFGEPIVLVGGSALAARSVRPFSENVDLWMPSFSDEVVHVVESEARAQWGPLVKLDVTSTENLWGNILVRDIALSPVVAHLTSSHGPIEVRALSIEDLFLLKLAAGRAKDLQDLSLLLAFTNAQQLIARFRTLSAWHGDRHALLGYADALVTWLVRDLGADPGATTGLGLPAFIQVALEEAHVDPG